VVGVLEWWNNGSGKPTLHYSITPSLQLGLFYRISFRHFVEKSFFLKFLQKTQVDKLLRFEILGVGQGRCQHVEHELNAFQGRIGFFRNGFNVAVVRVFKDIGIIRAHVFGEDSLGIFLVGVNIINRFDKAFERGLYSIPVTGDIGARSGKSVALHFDAEIADGHNLGQACFARQRRRRRRHVSGVENSRGYAGDPLGVESGGE